MPGALCEFDGKLAAGIGRSLRVYDLGKKKLLRKCENKVGVGDRSLLDYALFRDKTEGYGRKTLCG